VESEKDQTADPLYPPHGVPPGLRPSLIEIIAGAPRVLPVTQAIGHGSEESRAEAFIQGIRQANDLGSMHASFGLGEEKGLGPWHYRERRREGRRHRPTWDGDEVPQEPYEIEPVDPSRYGSF
jgi:hypothetical protein